MGGLVGYVGDIDMFLLKKRISKYYIKDTIKHNFNKIMFLSCVRISSNRYELTYVLDYVYNFNENRTLLPIKKIISYEEYKKIIKLKFGVWLKINRDFSYYGYIYLYQNQANNKLIYKSTKNDNYMHNGTMNQYNHELIFKGLIHNKCILECVGR